MLIAAFVGNAVLTLFYVLHFHLFRFENRFEYPLKIECEKRDHFTIAFTLVFIFVLNWNFKSLSLISKLNLELRLILVLIYF